MFSFLWDQNKEIGRLLLFKPDGFIPVKNTLLPRVIDVYGKKFEDYKAELHIKIQYTWRTNQPSPNTDTVWQDAESVSSYSHICQLTDVQCFYRVCLHRLDREADGLVHLIDLVHMIALLKGVLSYPELLLLAKDRSTDRRVIQTLTLVYQLFPHLNDVLPLSFELGTVRREGGAEPDKMFIL